jgi:hypothetical protein
VSKLVLQRLDADTNRTLGELFVDGDSYCWTCEDAIRMLKIAGETAIPAGTYDLLLTVSPRARAGGLWTPWPDFKLPLVSNVPGYAGIRVHSGNNASHTEGCILVGLDLQRDGVGNSRAALRRLMDDLKFPATITIHNPGGNK